MHASDLSFPTFPAAAHHASIRWALFVHPEIRDVLPTLHADTLRVLHDGPIAADAWGATLVAAGYPVPRIGDAPTLAAIVAR